MISWKANRTNVRNRGAIEPRSNCSSLTIRPTSSHLMHSCNEWLSTNSIFRLHSSIRAFHAKSSGKDRTADDWLTSTRSEAKLQTENHGSTELHKLNASFGVTEFLEPPTDIDREHNFELADFEARVDAQLQSSELDPTLIEQNRKSIAARLWGIS